MDRYRLGHLSVRNNAIFFGLNVQSGHHKNKINRSSGAHVIR